MRTASVLLVPTLLALVLTTPAAADRGNIRRLVRTAPRQVGLHLGPRWENAADMVVEQAARYLPVPTGASDFTYEWNPGSETFERTTTNHGPLFFVDRAETIGRGRWNVGVTYQYLLLDEWDGDPLFVADEGNGDRVRESAAALPFSSEGELAYHITTVNVTWGARDDVDLNLALPIVSLHAGLDPRTRDPGGPTRTARVRGQVNATIGDLHLRAKKRLFVRDALVASIGLDLRLPTGDPREAVATGDAEVEPFLALARSFLDGRIDMQWNVGASVNAEDTRHSTAVYAWGLSYQAWDWLSIAGSFLGRSEFTDRRSESSVSGLHVSGGATRRQPFLDLDPSRKDFFDATLGLRVRLHETLTFAVGFFRALNDDGIRSSEFSGVGAFEATF